MSTTNTLEIYNTLELDRFFAKDAMEWRLDEGRVLSVAKTRTLYLSEDLIHGVYDALLEETGPAWKMIFFNCGAVWGKRLAERIDKEMEALSGTLTASLPVADYIHFIENYFANHGWGILRVHLEDAESKGLVRVTLENSFCAKVLSDSDDYADPLVAGALSALFTHISGRQLGCMQYASSLLGHDCEMFVVSGARRLEDAENLLDEEPTPDAIYQRLVDQV